LLHNYVFSTPQPEQDPATHGKEVHHLTTLDTNNADALLVVLAINVVWGLAGDRMSGIAYLASGMRRGRWMVHKMDIRQRPASRGERLLK